jgi:hypothetical protein
VLGVYAIMRKYKGSDTLTTRTDAYDAYDGSQEERRGIWSQKAIPFATFLMALLKSCTSSFWTGHLDLAELTTIEEMMIVRNHVT